MGSEHTADKPAELRYEQVSKLFGNKAALSDFSLRIPAGQMVGIIGPSGAGKSTLLRLTNRLIAPSSGRIFYGDKDLTELRGRALQAWRAQAAMIFQQFNLIPRLDVLTNVLVGRLQHVSSGRALIKSFSPADRARAIAALDRFGVADTALKRADQISGGQQQRVAIARALVQEPHLLLADEPIASLDPRNARAVMDALKAVNTEDGITVLCNLHTLDTARAYCDRLIGLKAGRLIFDGPPSELDDAAVSEIYGQENPPTEETPIPADAVQGLAPANPTS